MIIALIAGLLPASANETVESRSFVIESIDGTEATLTKGTRKEFQLRQGTRLAAGNTVTTSKDTKVTIKLDDDSSITMAPSTKIDVSKLNRRELMLTVITGSISVNAAAQPADRSTTFKAGNSTMGIRGTIFTVTYMEGYVRIVMLEGELDIETSDGEFILMAGQTLEYPKQPDSDLAGNYPLDSIKPLDLEQLKSFTPEIISGNVWTNIYPIILVEIPDSFTLEVIQEHEELLIELGVITEEEAAMLDDLIEQRKVEEEAQAQAIEEALQEQQDTIDQLQQSVIYLGIPTDTNTGTGTGGNGGGTTPPEPTTPVVPTDPTSPTDPVDPEEPEDPANPEDPIDPEDPEEPEDPDDTTDTGDTGGSPPPPPPSTYGISLSTESGPVTDMFYWGMEPQGSLVGLMSTVTVSNTGNQPTGQLTIALSGTNANSFTISTDSLDSIPASSTGTFNIGVNNVSSLPVGIHVATVTITGENINESYELLVEITVTGISLTPTGTHTFDDAIEGYTSVTEHTVTITNIGIADTGNLTITLNGTDASSFSLSPTLIDNIGTATGSNTATFTVVPNTGLSPRTYNATVAIAGSTIGGLAFDVSFTVEAATYGISLSRTGTYTFTSMDYGYDSIDPLTVYITNSGNQQTGALIIELSGTNAGNFTLSTTSVANITAGGTGSFTIRPNTWLDAGTHSATITVSAAIGNNNPITSQSFVVSFTVTAEPTYGIELDDTSYYFVDQTEGYLYNDPYTVIITNTGNQPTGFLSIELSGDNAASFWLSNSSITNIAVGSTGSFTVRYQLDLDIGEHSATITILGDNGIDVTLDVFFTVNATHIVSNSDELRDALRDARPDETIQVISRIDYDDPINLHHEVTLSIASDVTFVTNGNFDILGTLIIASGSVVVMTESGQPYIGNDGIINILGTLMTGNVLHNQMNNHGTINIYGSFINDGHIWNFGTLNLSSNSTFINNDNFEHRNGILSINGTLINNSNMINGSTILINNGGKMVIEDTLTNLEHGASTGIIDIFNGGILEIESGGRLYNNDVLNVIGTLSNEGIIYLGGSSHIKGVSANTTTITGAGRLIMDGNPINVTTIENINITSMSIPIPTNNNYRLRLIMIYAYGIYQQGGVTMIGDDELIFDILIGWNGSNWEEAYTP